MQSSWKKLKEKAAPPLLLEIVSKRYGTKSFGVKDLLAITATDFPSLYCWISFTHLPRKTVLAFLADCIESVLSIKTPSAKKALSAARVWSRRASEATARRLAELGNKLYDEWDKSDTPREDQEYNALISIALFPGGDPPPPDSPVAEQALNDAANAVAINKKGQVDYKKKLRAYSDFVSLIRPYWKAQTSAPKRGKDPETSKELDSALQYILNL